MKASHKPNLPSIHPDVPASAIHILLNGYKQGLWVCDTFTSAYSSVTKLVDKNYAVIHHDTQNGKKTTLLQLTQKGASFIENNFLELLTEWSPYYIFPIMRSGDKVDLTEDITNPTDTPSNGVFKKLVNSPSGSSTLDRGTYVVQSIDQHSVILVDDVFIAYRLRTSDYRSTLRLNGASLTSEADEKAKRFGKIRVQSLVERLQDKIRTIQLAELIEELYLMPHTKDRLTHG